MYNYYVSHQKEIHVPEFDSLILSYRTNERKSIILRMDEENT